MYDIYIYIFFFIKTTFLFLSLCCQVCPRRRVIMRETIILWWSVLPYTDVGASRGRRVFTAAWGTLNGTKERAFSAEECAASDSWLAVAFAGRNPRSRKSSGSPHMPATYATVSRVYSSPALRLDAARHNMRASGVTINGWRAVSRMFDPAATLDGNLYAVRRIGPNLLATRHTFNL